LKIKSVHTRELPVAPEEVGPLLIRQHDALVEDLLDQAELAIARRRGILPKLPRAPLDRLTRFSGIAVPGVLVVLAALHASWALGSYWPADSERDLARYVLSDSERQRLGGDLPSAGLTWAVALSLGGAAAIVRTAATGARSRGLRAAAWGVAAVFFVRGVAYLPSDLTGGLEDTYRRLDLALYAPLCLCLAAGTAIVVRQTDGPIKGGPR
jgi:hypothetical protein